MNRGAVTSDTKSTEAVFAKIQKELSDRKIAARLNIPEGSVFAALKRTKSNASIAGTTRTLGWTRM